MQSDGNLAHLIIWVIRA